MSFASKLQEIRQINGISQEQFAEMLNVSRQSVSKWERGKGYPEIEKLIFISRRFGVSLDELLKDNDPGPVSQRRPVNLEKSFQTDVDEIYPGGQSGVFPETEVKQPAGIAQYGDYQFSGQQQSFSGGPRSRRHTDRKRFLRRFLVCLLGILAIVLSLSILIIAVSEYYDDRNYDDYVSVSHETYLADDAHCYLNEETGLYYIIIGDNGLISYLRNDELDTYIRLTDTDTGKTVYCYDFYYNDNLCIAIGDSLFVVPEYVTDTSIDADELDQYYIGKDTQKITRFLKKEYIPFDPETKETEPEVSEPDSEDQDTDEIAEERSDGQGPDDSDDKITEDMVSDEEQ